MAAVWELKEDKHGREGYWRQYLIEPAAAYHSEFMGLVTHQDFKVIKMWEIEAAAALAMELPAGILPYVPLMAGADEETVSLYSDLS